MSLATGSAFRHIRVTCMLDGRLLLRKMRRQPRRHMPRHETCHLSIFPMIIFPIAVLLIGVNETSGNPVPGPVTVVLTGHRASHQQHSHPTGSTLSLDCKNAGGPVSWTKNGNPLPNCTNSVWNARCLTLRLHYSDQRLIIREVTKRDEGRYRCKAKKEESPPFVFNVSDDTRITSSNVSLKYTPTVFSTLPTSGQGTTQSPMSLPTTGDTLAGISSQPSSRTYTSWYPVTGAVINDL
jgi:hypothetical protein